MARCEVETRFWNPENDTKDQCLTLEEALELFNHHVKFGDCYNVKDVTLRVNGEVVGWFDVEAAAEAEAD